MELKELPHGRHKVEEIVNFHSLGWVKMDGEWYALNRLSASPIRMRNREQRGAFARTIGVPAKEVEAYVRRVKRQRAKDALTEGLRNARALLQANGYNVIDTKDR